MLEAYSLNVEVGANAAIPFNNVTIEKGCSATLSAPATIELNKCGVYMVSFDGVTGTSSTVQLYKDEVAQPQAQSTGTTVSFVTLVQVPTNNTPCCCTSPVTLRVINTTAGTFTNANIVVTKIC